MPNDASPGKPKTRHSSRGRVGRCRADRQGAARTYLSPTIKSYISTIYRKSNVGSRTQGRALGRQPRLFRATAASTTGAAAP